ncbi:MAG: ribosomal protein S12 methylthiotransferase RimO [Actinobacteria bacterium RBG_16_67_15]|nr:MAG: ribosomal protein S12 methylthiotransferase RimO [Actinobacteria bacterium RBG_16_67_15]
MPGDAPTIWLTTLGCAKNQVDSDKIDARLEGAGYARAASPESADVVLVNTCAFIEAARRESIDAILDASARKRPDAGLVVLGCMAQRYQAELADSLPEADAVFGMERYGELVGALDRLTGWEPIRFEAGPMDILYEVRRPTPSTPYAYVKVAEGCDKPCTFCAIPQFRGKQRSRAALDIRSEIASLAAAGVGEIVLVAQDLASYGRDIAAPGGIVDLVRFVGDVTGLRSLRLLYLYPREITDDLIAEMTTNPVVVPYFDLSLQHASGRLLRAMRRPGDGVRHLELIDRIRAARPDAALRSSFIVGFPGETDDDVEVLADFLRTGRLDWAGFFPYSAEEGTPAADLPGRVPPDDAAERTRLLQEIQEEMTAQQNARQVGRVLDVVVDLVEEGIPVARSYREAPEIDGVIVLDRGRPGEWLRAEVTASYGSELEAVVA